MNPFDTPTNNFQHFNNLEKKPLPSHSINQTHQTINQITNSNRPSQLTNLDSHLSKDFSSHNFLPFWNWNLHENVTSAIIVNLHRKFKRKYVCVLKFVFYSHYFLYRITLSVMSVVDVSSQSTYRLCSGLLYPQNQFYSQMLLCRFELWISSLYKPA